MPQIHHSSRVEPEAGTAGRRPRGHASGAERCRRRFLKFFPGGFRDETYMEWERAYKWLAHERWMEQLAPRTLDHLIAGGHAVEAARRAVSIESRTNLLFSFEKMALRDAVRTRRGAETFARGLRDFLYGRGAMESRFERWCDAVSRLPRRQTRVLTWPIVTVFGFLARPEEHCFLKPHVTRVAATRYGFPFEYASKPEWRVYASLLEFAEQMRRDQRELRPRDMIDLQSFIWVQGSDEYA